MTSLVTLFLGLFNWTDMWAIGLAVWHVRVRMFSLDASVVGVNFLL